ncbi:MAG: hypothetical protein HQ536_01005 [Parcubacteria group bacterium]|nr:hypothetical protein [Parcubacteria group bacterium]
MQVSNRPEPKDTYAQLDNQARLQLVKLHRQLVKTDSFMWACFKVRAKAVDRSLLFAGKGFYTEVINEMKRAEQWAKQVDCNKADKKIQELREEIQRLCKNYKGHSLLEKPLACFLP